MVLMAYRHGLRASEVTDIKWEQVDFDRSAGDASPDRPGTAGVASAPRLRLQAGQ